MNSIKRYQKRGISKKQRHNREHREGNENNWRVQKHTQNRMADYSVLDFSCTTSLACSFFVCKRELK